MKLLSRVGDDIAKLRQDVRTLITHTTHETIPHGANELADLTKAGLTASGAYAASRLRALKEYENSRRSAELLGSAILLGALGYGIYAWMKCRCEKQRSCARELEEPSLHD
ncbi:hypothetical protein JIN85_02970 [Luteolibacter pohnpeiensis]|uniref:Uncharacterized protein n=1 Tax=Luteolibacter pohnpeiensis TaxID=454153 RepID=A0A934VUP7_9BACT|nr:hypothetical protein [Luteolibacter pohnpeiensis]MBK1881360.1 hypothetical protein [Luteolibacter pohnpeiensis]